jgi:hypothetical protein
MRSAKDIAQRAGAWRRCPAGMLSPPVSPVGGAVAGWRMLG